MELLKSAFGNNTEQQKVFLPMVFRFKIQATSVLLTLIVFHSIQYLQQLKLKFYRPIIVKLSDSISNHSSMFIHPFKNLKNANKKKRWQSWCSICLRNWTPTKATINSKEKFSSSFQRDFKKTRILDGELKTVIIACMFFFFLRLKPVCW